MQLIKINDKNEVLSIDNDKDKTTVSNFLKKEVRKQAIDFYNECVTTKTLDAYRFLLSKKGVQNNVLVALSKHYRKIKSLDEATEFIDEVIGYICTLMESLLEDKNTLVLLGEDLSLSIISKDDANYEIVNKLKGRVLDVALFLGFKKEEE